MTGLLYKKRKKTVATVFFLGSYQNTWSLF
nr:MAG TPA: hypothetical protein [Caudoviricetes sp.]